MEINKLVDLNNLRTAPQLSNSQEKKLIEELEANIFNAFNEKHYYCTIRISIY